MLPSCSCWISLTVPLAAFVCRADGFRPHVSASDQTDGDECSGKEAEPALSLFFPPSSSPPPPLLSLSLFLAPIFFPCFLSLSLPYLTFSPSLLLLLPLSSFFLFPQFFIPCPSHLSSCPPVSLPVFLLSFSRPPCHWFLPPLPLSLLPPLLPISPPPPPPPISIPSLSPSHHFSGYSKMCYKKLVTHVISRVENRVV